MSLIVQKYGGTSVGDVSKIKNIADKIIKTKAKGNKLVVVVSAMSDTTDVLIKLACEIATNPKEREMDALLSTGEIASAALLAMAINAKGQSAISLNGGQAGILTEDIYNKARIINIEPKRIKKELDLDNIVILAGFQGVNSFNDITTIGRGGSDTSAVAIAAALNADYCEIYTDVDGVYTADPRIVKNAKKLKTVSYAEMLELASLGAGVLHPRAVETAELHKIAIHVRSSFNDNEGTFIKEANEMERQKSVVGVAYDDEIAKVNVFGIIDKPGMAGELFSLIGLAKINIDVIVQSSHKDKNTNDITFTLPKSDLEKAINVIQQMLETKHCHSLEHDLEVGKVSIVGVGMISSPGIAAKMFKALGDNGINIDLISTSEIKISCIIAKKDIEKAVNILHNEFNLGALE